MISIIGQFQVLHQGFLDINHSLKNIQDRIYLVRDVSNPSRMVLKFLSATLALMPIRVQKVDMVDDFSNYKIKTHFLRGCSII